MTLDEAIDWLARMKSNTVNHTLDMPLWWNEPLAEALEMAIKALEQESALDKVRNEIAEYGSIWVAYAITGHSDRDIENLIEGVLKQAKEQVLNIIDKYRTESEDKE